MTESIILKDINHFVTDFFKKNISAEYVFHDYQHTLNVVHSALEIAENSGLESSDLELITIAAWFHDTGYIKGSDGHEARSCEIARAYLTNLKYPESRIAQIEGCIMATKLPQTPQNFMEQILGDADMSHLGKRSYWDRCERIRQELQLTKGISMNDEEWVDFEITFLQNHRYHTPVAQSLYDDRKQKYIKQLKELKHEQDLKNTLTINELADRIKAKEDKKKEKEKEKVSRGVETMFRTTYRTHISLSTSADNKAHIMLSINTIVLSLAVSNLVVKFQDNHRFILPTIVLVAVCLISMVFATLATRPKITEGKVTKEAILQRKANLLFFGNYYNMKLEEFHWGMMEMLKDDDFLYTAMTRDLYFLGVVLGKKYRYLSICYDIFMYGLIFAVLSFAVVFIA
ncbi:MAG: HD domain-containing protein [Saprospiraceae bacterium]|jgi:predicted metal-dependent HD superfamily phosphohydrolase|nr:HD domain-containing protein [Saprospiraceae bacterium]